jgi:2,3-bisphosphoglycerate-independent phosphoglycerate mutase
MRRLVLIVQDGWGIAPPGPGNYISQADTPNFGHFMKNYPHCQNKAAGNAVGLPEGAQGNSEVGHLHLGAGRIVWQMLERINRAIKNGEFCKNRALLAAIGHAVKKKSRLHLMGLCSDEGVHAHISHLFALLDMAKAQGLKKVAVHFFADGRDVPERSAKKYAEIIENKLAETGVGRIASIIGRYYSMDRDNNWDRTRKAYDMLTVGKGFKARNIFEAIKQAYERQDRAGNYTTANRTDYYIEPTVIEPFAPMRDNDSVIFFNFRRDRPRQLTRAFIEPSFTKFRREKRPKVLFTTMARYDEKFGCPAAFVSEKIKNNLGETLSRHGLRQLRLAETEKRAHVTYFFNSETEEPYRGEERIEIPSPKAASYDQKPEMSAFMIAQRAVKEIKSKKFDFILINFANCDLVGHSAVKKAIIKCVEVVDECTGMVVEAALKNHYTAIITADHGSAEDKLYPNGAPKPSHSTNPVNLILASNDEKLRVARLRNGGQQDVAPTILEIMGIEKPAEMTGKSLIMH